MTKVSISSIVLLMPKIFSSISYIQLVMLVAEVPVLFSKLFVYSFLRVCGFFINSIFTFKY